jgi:hypothetical protein
MRKLIFILALLLVTNAFAGLPVSAPNPTVVTADAAVDANTALLVIAQDSLDAILSHQATLLKTYVSAPVTMPNADTTDTQIGLVVDSTCWAEYIELVVTTNIANVTPTNVQLVLYNQTGPVAVSLNADTDWDNAQVGTRFIIDLDNFGAGQSTATIYKTVADPSSGCRIPLPAGSYFRLETGEASTSGAFQLRVIYRSNGGYLSSP